MTCTHSGWNYAGCTEDALPGTNRCGDCLRHAAADWDADHTYRVAPSRLHEVQERVLKLNKRAEKNDFPRVQLFIEPAEQVERSMQDSQGRTVKVKDWVHPVTVYAPESLCVAGWELIGRLDHTYTDSGPTALVSEVPGRVVPKQYWHSNADCDHCGWDRNRVKTYVLRHEDTGELKQVGHTCLRDFLGHNPDSLVAFAAALRSLRDELEVDGWDRDESAPRPKGYDLLTFLTTASAVYTQRGWVSMAMAREKDDLQPTAWAIEAALAPNAHKDNRVEISNEDIFRAEATIAWCRSLEARVGYEHNIKTLAETGFVLFKHVGFAASMIRAYERHLEALEAQKAKENNAQVSVSDYIGRPKQRLRNIPVTVAYTRDWESDYGHTFLLAVKDDSGNLLVWRTGNAPEIEVDGEYLPAVAGMELLLTGTVKAHSEFRGTKQTMVNRCKLATVAGHDYHATYKAA